MPIPPENNANPIEIDEGSSASSSFASRKRTRLGVAAAALAMTGVLGGVVGAVSMADHQTTTASASVAGTAQRNVGLRSDDGADDLESVTLGELAGELERLGLEVNISQADSNSGPDGNDDDGNNDDGNDDEDDYDAGSDPSGADSDADGVDPFEGMTDAEIDDLSDEEFFERLEAAGIDPEYDDDADWDNQDGSSDEDDWDQDGQDGSEGGEEDPTASLEVDGNDLDTSGVSADLAKKANEIWGRFTTLIPADQRQMVSRFELMPDAYDGAHVYPSETDPTKWILGVGGALGDDLDYVLVHEFGHLLTLQAKEVPPSTDGESCTTYFTGEGCALKGSTFAEFVQKFWPQTMRDQVNELYENEDYDGLDAFYERNKDRFVTDYAASNPGEDLAETFAHFVTEDRPTGDTVADQKVELLWADEDMVELRTEIRANL